MPGVPAPFYLAGARVDGFYGFGPTNRHGTEHHPLNDPTTAVQAIDRLHDLLRRVACPQPSGVFDDDGGTVRVVRKVMNLAGVDHPGVRGVRENGGTPVQAHRRLHGCLEDLLEIVPPDRQEPLQRQLRLQDKSTARYFREPEERALARERDDSGQGNEEPD